MAPIKLILCSMLLLPALTRAESPGDLPNIREGKLFTIVVTPMAKEIDVKVAGNRLAHVDMDHLGLFAKLYLGSREVILTPVQHGTKFVLVPPVVEPGSRLELKVKSGSASETFDVQLSRPR